MRFFLIILVTFAFAVVSRPCDIGGPIGQGPEQYEWNRVAGNASFPEGYNYPVFGFGEWMVAMNHGAWLSTDGERWVKTDLPEIGLNSAYQKFVRFKGAIYALGTMTGNYEDLRLTTKISRTRDLHTWETVAQRSNLPERVFYGAAVFAGKIWLVGGYDGRKYYNDVWTSSDSVHWQRVSENAGWSPRTTRLSVFQNKLWLLGGGVIDGQSSSNPNSDSEIWTSVDGVRWDQVQNNAPGKLAGTPIVFDNKLWLIGANRNNGKFDNALWVSADGIDWQKRSAPWSPRGGVSVWEFGGKLYVTGGKFSETVNGEIKFFYSNDIWTMSKKNPAVADARIDYILGDDCRDMISELTGAQPESR